MNKFMRSLLIGAGASVFLIVAIAGIGLWVSNEPDMITSGGFGDGKSYTVRMRPQPIPVGGFSLKGKDKAKAQVMMVSVELTVDGAANPRTVCRLMPRLVAKVNTAFAGLASFDPGASRALSKQMGPKLVGQFNRAIGGDSIQAVSFQVYADKGKAPGTSCPKET